MPMFTLSPSKHTGMIRIRFIYLYCLVIIVDNDQSIFGLASPFSHKSLAFKLISYPISILLLYLNSGINIWIPSIAQFMDLAFSFFVWSCDKRKSPNKYWKSTRNLLFCWWLTGQNWIDELLNGHSGRFYNQLGMHKHVFSALVKVLQSWTAFADTKYVSAEEQLAIFLHFAWWGESNRALQEQFQCSPDTITK